MRKPVLLLLLCLAATPAYAVDGAYVEYGRGDASVISSPAQAKIARIGAIWKWHKSWFNNGNWHVTGFWDVSLARWYGESPGGENQTITDVGIMPVFRLAPKAGAGIAPYFEAGLLGLHLISHTWIYPGRRFSTAFQFGHILGFGIRLGAQRQFEIGFRYQHVSNGDIKLPNEGMDFNLLHLGYRF